LINFLSIDEVTFKLRKKYKGEHFEDTDMINYLLSKDNKEKAKKKNLKIEVLGGQEFNKEETKEDETTGVNKDDTKILKKEPHEIYSYGFNRNFSHFFDNLEVRFCYFLV